MRQIFLTSFLLGSFFCMSGCFFFYKFDATSIPAEANTFFVTTFEDKVNGINTPPPTLFQDFSDQLIEKVQNQSKLSLTAEDPDIQFNGSFTRYNITYVAPKSGEEASFNRLEVTVSVEYSYKGDEKQNWTSSFSFFGDFDINSNLSDVEDQLITDITEQLIEDIFNKAFTNW